LLLGDRVAFEPLDHLVCLFYLDDDRVARVLDRFASIDPAVLRAVGADRLPSPPLYPVDGKQ
jgi:hypothetical protein